MDGYELVAALFDSVTKLLGSMAWPAAFVVLIVLFRSRLYELLPKLHFRYKDAEVEFRLDQAEQEARALPPLPGGENEVEPTPEEKSRFEKIAELSPRAAIIEARVDVAEAVRSLARRANLQPSYQVSTLVLTRKLRSKNLLNSNLSALLEDLRVIGNTAAHNYGWDVTMEDALRYRELADKVISQLQAQQPAPADEG